MEGGAMAVAQPAHAAPGRPYTNPIRSQEGADPRLRCHNGSHHLVATSFTPGGWQLQPV
jgi:hypothetical protein